MERQEIRDKVKEIIADVAGIDPAGIGDEAHFFEDLDLDSLALLEMGVDVDYAFKLGAPDEELKELRTVPQAVALVEVYLARKAGTSRAPQGDASFTSQGDSTLAPQGDSTLAPRGDSTLAPRGDSTLAPRGDSTLAPRGDSTQVA